MRKCSKNVYSKFEATDSIIKKKKVRSPGTQGGSMRMMGSCGRRRTHYKNIKTNCYIDKGSGGRIFNSGSLPKLDWKLGQKKNWRNLCFKASPIQKASLCLEIPPPKMKKRQK